MYSAIKLTETMSRLYKMEDNEQEINNLSKINIFIGPNNSGKSRFLRQLFLYDKPLFTITGISQPKIANNFQILINSIRNILSSSGLNLHQIGIDGQSFQVDNSTYFNDITQLEAAHNELKKISEMKGFAPSGYQHTIGSYSILSFNQSIYNSIEHCWQSLDGKLDKLNYRSFKKSHIHIPILRGLRNTNINQGHVDFYKKRTIDDYFKTKNNIDDAIFTGLSLYEDIKRLLLGVSAERKKVKDFEQFLSEVFFEGSEVNIIPHIDNNVVYVKIGDDDDRPIYDLGEGIQSIIILTYPLFLHQGEHINFFFEEPDMFLHPGYQRIFLETLNQERFNTFQYFFTTHSNHFLDMTLAFKSTSVYAFQRKGKEEFHIRNIKNADKDILQALGVRSSSVFLTNCTIWVEGITDRIYIRKYLQLLMMGKIEGGGTSFKEDIHYSFVEYGGNNITHWSFLESEDENFSNIDVIPLCGKLFLITDSDDAKKGSKKLKRQEKLNEALGDNFYCLEAKEIENLLMENVLISSIKEFEKNDCNTIDFTIKHDEYKSKSLGTYIDNKIEGLSRKYGSDSGTIVNKVQFAKVATSKMETLADISEEAKQLAEKLYDFIGRNNS